MPPVDFIGLAADLGCPFIGIGLQAMRHANPHAYPDWSFRIDAALRRETVAALRDRGVGLGLVEDFGVEPGRDARLLAPDLDIVAELGGTRINIASMSREREAVFDGFAALAELADDRGIEVVIEIGPGPVRTLDAGVAAVAHVGRANFRLLIDTMHYFRFGGTIEAIASLDPDLIGYVQLCDAPAGKGAMSYMEEALFERLPPGEGALPLAGFMALIPVKTSVSLEIPQRALAERGVAPFERVSHCLEAARRLYPFKCSRM
jgi:sugar phosphate isomerase/epimerase